MRDRTLASDEVAVWYRFTDRLSASELAAMDAALSNDERSRRSRLVFDRDRHDFTAAHALVREALSCYAHVPPAAWEFERDEHGKPALVPAQAATTQLAFNLSHTHPIVACAITGGESVGIDVEQCGRLTDAFKIAAQYFTAAECEALSRCAPGEVNTRFIELWTLKEAYLKAVGIGLRMPLNAFGFLLDGRGGLLFSGAEHSGAWQFWLASLHNARLAVAVRASAARPRISFHGPPGGANRPRVLCATTPLAPGIQGR